MTDLRRSSPAALRNRALIHEAIAPHLPATGTVLEIASGSGEHVVHFARESPALVFQPSDPDPGALASMAALIDDMRLSNVRRRSFSTSRSHGRSMTPMPSSAST